MGKCFSTYSVKIKHYNHVFKETVVQYRKATDFFIKVVLNEWDAVLQLNGVKNQQSYIERISCTTSTHPNPKYDFTSYMYKYPCYYRRAAITEAIGKVSSYKSNYANWEQTKTGKPPVINSCGCVYPALYRENSYVRESLYVAKIKVFVHNTWDWITVDLKKSDVDYIEHHCQNRKACVPTLQKRGKEWFLDFVFEETCSLNKTPVEDQLILACDLGINSACTCSVMNSGGTILGREFLSLPREQDSLTHAVNRIKKAQQNRCYKTPRLWARAKGINDDIAVKTAKFIMETAILYNVDVIVFEHLDLGGKVKGSKKQKLHLWKARYVQSMVTDKAHRNGIRISHVNAWKTSALAYDGSGPVVRGKKANLPTYSLCRFTTGKVYNCDLSASYNIGARYFIRELIKSLPEKARLGIEAKVPQCTKRSTCTFSTLISLNAELLSA